MLTATTSLTCSAPPSSVRRTINWPSDDVAELIAAKGVLWAPDFLVNAGGVIYGAHMEVGSRNADTGDAGRDRDRFDTQRRVSAAPEVRGVTPLAAAQSIAMERVDRRRKDRRR